MKGRTQVDKSEYPDCHTVGKLRAKIAEGNHLQQGEVIAIFAGGGLLSDDVLTAKQGTMFWQKMPKTRYDNLIKQNTVVPKTGAVAAKQPVEQTFKIRNIEGQVEEIRGIDIDAALEAKFGKRHQFYPKPWENRSDNDYSKFTFCGTDYRLYEGAKGTIPISIETNDEDALHKIEDFSGIYFVAFDKASSTYVEIEKPLITCNVTIGDLKTFLNIELTEEKTVESIIDELQLQGQYQDFDMYLQGMSPHRLRHRDVLQFEGYKKGEFIRIKDKYGNVKGVSLKPGQDHRSIIENAIFGKSNIETLLWHPMTEKFPYRENGDYTDINFYVPAKANTAKIQLPNRNFIYVDIADVDTVNQLKDKLAMDPRVSTHYEIDELKLIERYYFNFNVNRMEELQEANFNKLEDKQRLIGLNINTEALLEFSIVGRVKPKPQPQPQPAPVEVNAPVPVEVKVAVEVKVEAAAEAPQQVETKKKESNHSGTNSYIDLSRLKKSLGLGAVAGVFSWLASSFMKASPSNGISAVVGIASAILSYAYLTHQDKDKAADTHQK